MVNLVDIKDSKDPEVKFDNRYRLIKKIGGGGFSEVWLAHDTNADMDVALKIYTPNGELDEEGKEDFKKEFARLCGLNHSNIIHAIGFGIHDDELPYLAMSVCKNGSAKKLIGHYEEKELWTFIEQVALGLKYLHDHDITHQDIKPDNILINSDGQYLIIDFGISTKTRNTLRKTNQSSAGGGTPWYMSIESYGTETPNIHARDIWAFGATLYEIITGDVPFGQYGGISQKSQNGKIPPITANVSTDLKQLVYDCLALDAWDRPNADEIIQRVKKHREGSTDNDEKKKSKKLIFSAASAILVVLCCYFGYTYLAPSKTNDNDNKEISIVRANDSIYLERINKAIAITQPEIQKSDPSSIDEKALCSAAEIFEEAKGLTISDSAKVQGDKIWMASQQVIDNTYEYLYNKGIEYGEIGAETASQNFEKRCSLLMNYVTPSKVKHSKIKIKEQKIQKKKPREMNTNHSMRIDNDRKMETIHSHNEITRIDNDIHLTKIKQ